jgi:hypothetical protein
MARQIWGCYAVADHKKPKAFVADVLLYERLVVPVPPRHGLPPVGRREGARGSIGGPSAEGIAGARDRLFVAAKRSWLPRRGPLAT